MFDFAAVLVEVADFIDHALELFDPTTLIGGALAVLVVGRLLVGAVRRMIGVAG